jgi:hypothetical protein
MVRVLCAFALVALVASLAFADPADVAVGSARSVFAKNGTRMTEQPKALSKLVKLLPYGTRVRVDEVQGRWIKVTEFEGTAAGSVGWIKAAETVEPFALTQGGQFRSTGASSGDGSVSRREAAAASRQFSPMTEAAHKQVSPAEVQAAYGLLDTVLEVMKPSIEEIEQFVAEGRLGRPESESTPNGG